MKTNRRRKCNMISRHAVAPTLLETWTAGWTPIPRYKVNKQDGKERSVRDSRRVASTSEQAEKAT